MEPTGMILWDLDTCATYLEGLKSTELSGLVKDLAPYGRGRREMYGPAALEASKVVYTSLRLSWSVVHALVARLEFPGEPLRQHFWDQAQAARQEALDSLVETEWPEGAEVANLQAVLSFVLSIEPEDVEAEFELPMDVLEVVEVLRRIERRLDVFERAVSLRGNAPR